MAVRIECMTDGRFSGAHFQSFTRPIFRTRPESATPIWMWNALPFVRCKGHHQVVRMLGGIRVYQILTNLHELLESLYQLTACESVK